VSGDAFLFLAVFAAAAVEAVTIVLAAGLSSPPA
jgi:hypothetical protein